MNLTVAFLTFHLFTGISGQGVFVASPLSDWNEHPMKMTETAAGDYTLTVERPWLHELPYKFIVDGKWETDPANPVQAPDGQGGMNSVIPVPFVEDPLLEAQRGVPDWVQTTLTINDLEGAAREITVLSPPAGFATEGRRRMTIYFQDGGDYLDEGGARRLLANLSTLRADFPILTGVFVPPKDREREYECLDAYADFTAGPLVREIESRFPASGRAEDRILIGPSLGGLITLYTALKHPDVFARAGSQSGSLWYQDGRLVPLLAAAARAHLKLFLEVGTFEDEDMLKYNRQAAQVLRDAGAEFRYAEYPSIHNWIAWRNRLGEILGYLVSDSTPPGR